MSYNIITQQEATFYYLTPSATVVIGFLSNNQLNTHLSFDIDDVIKGIVYVINKEKYKIPFSQFTYQWFYGKFKNIIGNDEVVYHIFYTELRGSIKLHTAYSSQLQFYINLSAKDIGIRYKPLNWKQLLGTRVYPLINYLSNIK